MHHHAVINVEQSSEPTRCSQKKRYAPIWLRRAMLSP